MARARKPPKSSLAIVEHGYRGSLEEQYGHIAWLTRIMKAMNAPTALLLKGDAVLLARRAQPRLALTIGDLQVVPSHYESGIEAVVAADVPVYAWEADLRRLGLTGAQLVEGVALLRSGDLPALIQRYDCTWYW